MPLDVRNDSVGVGSRFLVKPMTRKEYLTSVDMSSSCTTSALNIRFSARRNIVRSAGFR